MRLALPLLLIASSLLTACGGSSSGDNPTTTPDEAPVAVSGHFFSYVSDGSHIHAVDMSSGEVSEVATLAAPTELLNYIRLSPRRGQLEGRTIEWSDLLYVDAGRLYLLRARSETAAPPAPRQLSSMANIDTSCGTTVSVSADGKHEGLLFFVPDAGKDCQDNMGVSYLITTDMNSGNSPISGPPSWNEDHPVFKDIRGSRHISGFMGIRNQQLVQLNTAHQPVRVLKNDVAQLNGLIQLDDRQSTPILLDLQSPDETSDMYFLDFAHHALSPVLGWQALMPLFISGTKNDQWFFASMHMYNGNQIYTASARPDGMHITALGCPPLLSLPWRLDISDNGQLVILTLSGFFLHEHSLTVLNPETCEQRNLARNVPLMGFSLVSGNHVFFNDSEAAAFHAEDIANNESNIIEDSKAVATISRLSAQSSEADKIILLSNTSPDAGESTLIESYDFDGTRLVLGSLENDKEISSSSFWNEAGHPLSLGIAKIWSRDNSSAHARLYGFKADEAGSLTVLMEKDFLQKL